MGFLYAMDTEAGNNKTVFRQLGILPPSFPAKAIVSIPFLASALQCIYKVGRLTAGALNLLSCRR